MNLKDLSPDQRAGLAANIASLEAQEDSRYAMLLGAVFGGEEGREYLKYLQDCAWWQEPQTAETAKQAIDVSDTARNIHGTN